MAEPRCHAKGRNRRDAVIRKNVGQQPDLPHSGRPGQGGGARDAGCRWLHIRNRIETEKNAAGKPVLTLRRERMELRSMRVPQQPLKSGLPVKPGAACGFQRLFDGRQDSAFVARWCAGSKFEAVDGAYRIRGDDPSARMAAPPHRTP